MLTLFPIVMVLSSPRSTAPCQILDWSPMVTFPIMVAFGAMNEAPTDGTAFWYLMAFVAGSTTKINQNGIPIHRKKEITCINIRIALKASTCPVHTLPNNSQHTAKQTPHFDGSLIFIQLTETNNNCTIPPSNYKYMLL